MGLRKSEMDISLQISDDRDLPGRELYRGDTSPAAMMRAQQRLELPWVLEKIRRHIGYRAHILDLGCGYGSVANELACKGHTVTAVDSDPETLAIAKVWDKTQSVQYRLGDIRKLPCSNESYDVVTALDILYHINHCAEVLHEANRVLRPGGIFIFNNFNRTSASWLLAVKGLEWFIKDTPAHYHDFKRFQKPHQFAKRLRRAGLEPMQICGVRPVFLQTSFIKLIYSGCVSENFRFQFCRHPWLGYVGFAQKRRFH